MEFLAGATLSNVFVILFVTLAFVSSLFHALKKYRNVSKNGKTIPGPWKLPLIGNIHQMVGGLPHRVLRDMAKKHGPFFKIQLGEVPFIVITSPRLAKESLKTHSTVFAGRPQILAFKVIFYDCKDIACHTYDDYWRQMRKICNQELLSAKSVKLLLPVRQEEGDCLISLARNSVGKSFNLTEAISNYTMSVVCRAAFGRLCVDRDEFQKIFNQIVLFANGLDAGDLFPSLKFLHFLSGMMPKLLKIHSRIDTFMDDIINEHIHHFSSTKKCNGEGGEEDLIDSLLRVKDTGNLKFPITNIDIKAMLLDMFIGGFESSSSVTVWAMTELIRDPRAMTKAQSEIRQAFKGKESLDEDDIFELIYLNFVVKETLRLHPPAPLLFPKQTIEDCVIDEYTIPAKTKVLINAWAIGRDPAYWTDPECFIPERFENSNIDFMGNNFEFLPFGAGKRICPGIAFGIANVKLPLALLLYHFDWVGLKPEDFDITETNGATARRKFDLCLIPTLPSTVAAG